MLMFIAGAAFTIYAAITAVLLAIGTGLRMDTKGFIATLLWPVLLPIGYVWTRFER